MRIRVLVLLVFACGISALLAAPRTDLPCLVQKTVHAGDPEFTGWSCVHYAALRSDTDALRRMLEYGADIDQRSAAGRTPLAEAAKRGDLKTVRFLLARSAEVRTSDRAGLTPLHLAARAQHPAVVRRLLAAGADPDARNRWRQTPLWLAAWQTWRGNTEIAHNLVAAGASVDAADENGNTPLHMAARAGHHAMVEYLVGQGALIERANDRGRTPLYQSALGGHLPSARLLLRAGADPNVRVGDWTPLRAALSDGHRDMADLLAAHGAEGYERYAAAARLDQGYRMLENERPGEALDAFERAIAMQPDNPRGYYYRGLARLRQGQEERALEDFTHTLALEPEHLDALERVGMTRARRGEHREAVAALEKLVNARPDYGRGYHLLAQSLQQTDQTERARSDQNTACRLGYSPACAGSD